MTHDVGSGNIRVGKFGKWDYCGKKTIVGRVIV